MVVSCSAFGCKERFKKGGSYTFHKFPKNENLRELWVKSICRQDFVPSDYARVCSKHFEPQCFNREKYTGQTWLNSDAVPTLIDFPSHLVKKANQSKKKTDECSADIPKAKRLNYLGDFTEDDMNSPTKSRKVLQIAKTLKCEHLEKKKKNKYMEEKAALLKDVINKMKKKKLISGNVLEI